MGTLAVPLWVWAATIAALVLAVGAELLVAVRRGAHEVGMREAALWTGGVVALAVVFGLSIGALGHPAAAGQFFAGWLTEYSLSLDNLFIFVLLIGSSAVPKALHSRVLLIGVLIALLLRGIFIAAGASAISRFGWVLFLFSAVLIGTAVRLAVSGRSRADHAPAEGLALRLFRRVVPVSERSDGGRLTTRVRGRRMATPVLVLIIAIAATDLAFALDSIPAIFGLTRDPYLVFTANVFALLGLRHLYFLIGGLLSRLAHLSAGLAIILGFIGVKLLAEALIESGIHHLGPVPVPHIGTGLSLIVVGGVLAVVTVTSLLAGRGHRELEAGDAAEVQPGTVVAPDHPKDDRAARRAAGDQAGPVGVDHGAGNGAAGAARRAPADGRGHIDGEQLAKSTAQHVSVQVRGHPTPPIRRADHRSARSALS
jgi:tellurite resistance protein TerC